MVEEKKESLWVDLDPLFFFTPPYTPSVDQVMASWILDIRS